MKTRISISALVDTINGHKIGILNKRYLLKGKNVFSAIGGACDVLDRNRLEREFKTSNYESETDARFKMPNHLIPEFKKLLFSKYEDMSKIIDFSICRELEEELSTIELPSQEKPFLTKKEVENIKQSISHKVFNFSNERQTFRFFVYYKLEMNEDVFKSLIDNKEIRVFSNEEIINKVTNDGIEIAGNIT